MAAVFGICLAFAMGCTVYAEGETDSVQMPQETGIALSESDAAEIADVVSTGETGEDTAAGETGEEAGAGSDVGASESISEETGDSAGEETSPPAITPGWNTEDGKTFYILEDGNRATGKQTIDGKLYYFDTDGTMQTGLVNIDGKAYWFLETGEAIKAGWNTCQDGKKRYGKANGQFRTDYKKIEKHYYYLDETDGAMITGAVKIKGKPYWFNDNGRAASKGWVKTGDGNKAYSLGKGKLKTGWASIKDYGYYFNKKTGLMAKNTTVKGVKIGKSGRLNKAYGRAIKVLDKRGWSLRAAYEYSAALPYQTMTVNYKKGSYWFANYGFSKKRGNCYVAAGTFYVMAKLLGHDVHQMAGYVGASAAHSWCEIIHNGKIYVYDPSFMVLHDKNGYKIRYGQRGTWKYNLSRSHRMN